MEIEDDGIDENLHEMDENLKGFISSTETLLDGHKAFAKFKVYRLDSIHRTFYPLKYKTDCVIIPTEWMVEAKYQRASDGSYSFSIKLIRTDSSDNRVRASLVVKFYDISDLTPVYSVSESRERMVTGQALEGKKDEIPPEILKEIVTVELTIIIKQCHTNTDWQCASKVDIDKKDLNLSKL